MLILPHGQPLTAWESRQLDGHTQIPSRSILPPATDSEAACRVAQKNFGDANRPDSTRSPRALVASTENGADADDSSAQPVAEEKEDVTEEQFYAPRAPSHNPPIN